MAGLPWLLSIPAAREGWVVARCLPEVLLALPRREVPLPKAVFPDAVPREPRVEGAEKASARDERLADAFVDGLKDR
jgi:hypothetical protein